MSTRAEQALERREEGHRTAATSQKAKTRKRVTRNAGKVSIAKLRQEGALPCGKQETAASIVHGADRELNHMRVPIRMTSST
jgi:hypothetical protein